MPLPKVLHHAGYAILATLDDEEKRRLRMTSKTVEETCSSCQTDFLLSFCDPAQWLRCLYRFPNTNRLRVFPNTLSQLRRVNMQQLVALDMTACGLTYLNVKPLGLPAALRRASSLKEFDVSQNPALQTSGLRTLLKALSSAGAVLHTLGAASTGIRRLPLLDSALLSQLECLRVTRNQLSHNVIASMFSTLKNLRRPSVEVYGMDAEAISRTNRVTMLSWCRCTPEGMSTLLASGAMTSASLYCASPGRWTWTPATPIGPNLRRLCLGNVTMPEDAWTRFLSALSAATTIEELKLYSLGTFTHEALLGFVASHRDPSKFKGLGMVYLFTFTEAHLIALCTAMAARNIRLSKWILLGCRMLKLKTSAKAFVATLESPVHLDIGTTSPAMLSKRAEMAWVAEVVRSATFSHLDLSGRSAIMDEDVPAAALAPVERMCLRNAEINWGLNKIMPKLKHLSLDNVESRYYIPEALFEQALRQSSLSHIVMNHCRLEGPFESSRAKYVSELRMDWCDIGRRFRRCFLKALERGDFPVLSSLSIVNASPVLVCMLVSALRRGQRNCNINATGPLWTEIQVRFLGVVLREAQLGSIGRLQIGVANSAKAAFEQLQGAFPHIMLIGK